MKYRFKYTNSDGTFIILGISLALMIGWVINLIQFVNCDFAPFNKEEILRLVGLVIAPLGSLLGLFWWP